MTLGINLSFFITIHRCHGQCEGTSQRPMVVQRLIFKAQMISLKKPWISPWWFRTSSWITRGPEGSNTSNVNPGLISHGLWRLGGYSPNSHDLILKLPSQLNSLGLYKSRVDIYIYIYSCFHPSMRPDEPCCDLGKVDFEVPEIYSSWVDGKIRLAGGICNLAILGPKNDPPSRFGTAHIRFCTVSPMKKVEVPAGRCGISGAGGTWDSIGSS